MTAVNLTANCSDLSDKVLQPYHARVRVVAAMPKDRDREAAYFEWRGGCTDAEAERERGAGGQRPQRVDCGGFWRAAVPVRGAPQAVGADPGLDAVTRTSVVNADT